MTKQKSTFAALLFLCMMQSLISFSQVQTPRYVSMTANSNAYYEYLPQGYPEPGVKYPVMIFLHGQGELGNGSPTSLPAVLRNGPPKLIANGTFPASFVSNGITYKFIVISPQFTIRPYFTDMDNIVNYTIANYNVDVNRVYVTGLSMGGGILWEFVGETVNRAQRIAAVLPVCGASFPYPANVANIATANLPVWATHNSMDPTVPPSNTIDYVNLINARPVPPTPRAKMTIFPVANPQHDAWTKTYDPAFKEDNMNVYEWLLQYRRNFAVLPITGLALNVQKTSSSKALLQWSTATEVNNSAFNILRSNDGVNFLSIGSVNSTAMNGTGANYSFTDNAPLKGTNYYRLEVKDLDGNKTYSDIKSVQFAPTSASLSFYPNPVIDQMNVSLGQVSTKATLRISNALGQVVQTQTIIGSSTIVSVSKLGAGVYYAEVIISGEAPQRFQFMKK